jgi:ribose 5-phosphate isomerase B
MKTIYIGSDHAGFILKEYVKVRLNEAGFNFEDVGCFTNESVDYPDFASKVAIAIQEGKADSGILICGSGEGMVMAANKFTGIKAGLAWNTEVASLLRKHNDAQIICLGARFTAPDYAWTMVEAFLNSDFEGGNHERRVKKVNAMC